MSLPIRLMRRGRVVGYTVVDGADYVAVAQSEWTLVGKGYAARQSSHPVVYLHRYLLGLEPGDPRQADHINGDRLDNRRANLRIVTSAENRQNIVAGIGSSRFRGVTWDKSRGKWKAGGQLDGKHHHIGRFDSEEEAGWAARCWREEHMPFAARERITSDELPATDTEETP